ncbi:MAG: MFS transporter, partial [Actinobacteria bacterium]|nr:MFS transporter [Actinomycetota bacterium]
TLFWAYTGAATLTMLLALAASTGSPLLTLLALTVAVFGASCAWMSAYPAFSELFPTHLRATGVGVSVAAGRVGAIIGAVVLAETASSFGLWSAFGALAGLWLIGAVAAGLWWLRGIEARGLSLETLAEPSRRPHSASARA